MQIHEDRILVLDRATTAQLFTLDAAIDAVESAFRARTAGEARDFPIVRERLENGAVCGVKSGYWPGHGVVGLKFAGLWPQNRDRGLENHQATVVLCDAETGRLRALIDGNVVTRQRTAAAGALGLRELARPDATVLTVLGAGVQAAAQIEAALRVCRGLRTVQIWSRRPANAEALAAQLHAGGVDAVAVAELAHALERSDIVVTATASTAALFEPAAIAPGTHVNAMGADTRGKRELPPALVEAATLVVDDRDQARSLGESQPPVQWAREPATIGEVLLKRRPGRSSPGEVTVFDSSGLGLQDLHSAAWLYRQAVATGCGLWLDWA